MMAVTLPNTTACINATDETKTPGISPPPHRGQDRNGIGVMRPCFLGYIHDSDYYLPFIVCLPPINMVQIEKIFSESVLAETFPKPTLVKLLRAK